MATEKMFFACRLAAKQRLKLSFFDGLRCYFYDHYLQKVILRRDAKYETGALVGEREKLLGAPALFDTLFELPSRK